MKQFVKYIASAALLGSVSLLQGCVKDGPGGEPNPNPNPSGKGNAYLSLTVDMRANATDTRFFDDMYMPEDREMMVEGVRLVIYGDDKVQVCKDLDVTNIIAGDPETLNTEFTGADVAGNPMEYVFVTHVMDVEEAGLDLLSDDIKLLILFNANDKLKEMTEVGKSVSEIQKAAAYTEADFMGENGTRFMMSNSQELVPINKYAHFRPTEQESRDFPVPVLVMRGVARVSVSIGTYGGGVRSAGVTPQANIDDLPTRFMGYRDDNTPRFPNTYGGTINYRMGAYPRDVRWGVNITNKKSYWMRKMTYDRYGQMEYYNGNEGINPFNHYAEDPNFEGFSVYNGGSPASRESNFVYIQDGSTINKELLAFPDDGTHVPIPAELCAYVPENTMVRDDQWNDFMRKGVFDVATTVVLGIRLHLYEQLPQRMETRAPTPIENHIFMCDVLTTDDGFKQGVILGMRRNANSYLQGVYDEMMFDGLLPTITDLMKLNEWRRYAGLKEAVQYLVDNHGWDGYSDIDWDNIPSFKAGAFKFFNDGLMYYNIPIRHFDYSSFYGEKGYGVVRNNFYHIGLDYDIYGPGTVEPEVPGVLFENAWLMVSPWNEVTLEFPVGEYN